MISGQDWSDRYTWGGLILALILLGFTVYFLIFRQFICLIDLTALSSCLPPSVLIFKSSAAIAANPKSTQKQTTNIQKRPQNQSKMRAHCSVVLPRRLMHFLNQPYDFLLYQNTINKRTITRPKASKCLLFKLYDPELAHWVNVSPIVLRSSPVFEIAASAKSFASLISFLISTVFILC